MFLFYFKGTPPQEDFKTGLASTQQLNRPCLDELA
jgi:hypothetical protein